MNTIRQYKVQNIEFVEISNGADYQVTLTSFGASIYTIYYKQKLMNVQVEDYSHFFKENIRYGKTIGRVAGRIANSKYEANGQTYEVWPNEGKNCLHGSDCFAQRAFRLKLIESNEQFTKIVYHLYSIDGDCGFGGGMHMYVTYIIDANQPIITMEYEYVCDLDCPINITNHTYYSLGDSNIDNLSIRINASKYASTNPEDLIQHEIKPVTKCLDFTKFKLLNKDIDEEEINVGMLSGYDHYFLFDKIDDKNSQITLRNNQFQMDVYTDYEGTQIYTNNNVKAIKCLNTMQFNRRGVAIEPQNCALKNSLIVPANKKVKHFIQIKFSTIK